ncbi:hypothetical protein H4R34_001558 [Dimargaris verticillata]|uniref:Uncharacterized protein n=1 Tax=Dimargaris verticillata TaxID=2761393 RepID=A0A9W8B9N8_9FUNG|nr:hypothetical protein H4R34_001558 [Dimargaris verticillata]
MTSPYFIEPQAYSLGPERPTTFTFSTELMATFDQYFNKLAEDVDAAPETAGVRAAHDKLTAREGRQSGPHLTTPTDSAVLSGATLEASRSSLVAPSTQDTTELNRDSFEEQNVFRSSCISQTPAATASTTSKSERPNSLVSNHLQRLTDLPELTSTVKKRWSMPFRRKRDSQQADTEADAPPPTSVSYSPLPTASALAEAEPQHKHPSKRHSFGNLMGLSNSIKKAGTWTRNSLRRSVLVSEPVPEPAPVPIVAPLARVSSESVAAGPSIDTIRQSCELDLDPTKPRSPLWTVMLGPFAPCTARH